MLEEILTRIRNIGLSSPEESVPYITDEPKIPNFLTLPNETAQERYSTDGDHGQGYHPHETLSRVKSVAEYLERLCIDNPRKDRLFVQKFDDKEEMVDPGIFCCYSNEQIGDREKFKKDARESDYLWVQSRDLINGGVKFIPAQLVYLSNLFKGEFGIRKESISTGTAFGKEGTDRALNSGLLEVIERDSCIYPYISRTELPRIIDFNGKIGQLEEYLKRYNLEVFAFDATSDLDVPTVISAVIDKTGFGPAVDVGSASDFTYEDSAYKSILEAIQCRRHARLFKEGSFSEGAPNEDEIFSLEDRFVYWQPLERINDLSFWLESEKEISYSSLKSRVNNPQEILSKLGERKFNIFEVDITLPELKKEGFETKKIIIPELHPLYLDERAKALYSIHYGEVKEDKSLKPHPLT
ncbi:MAG: YcaO-like family protein [Candidatus Pacearchaeota archaeon]